MSRPRSARPIVPAAGQRRAAQPLAAEPALAHLSFALGRAYYNYLAMLQRVLVETGLERHLRPGMGPVLFALFEHDDRVIKDLVERVQLSYSTLSGMLRRMARAGVIVCRRDARDGRAIRVRLTPLGKSLEPRCREALSAVDRVMHASISRREAGRVRRTLDRMIGTMRAYGAGNEQDGQAPEN